MHMIRDIINLSSDRTSVSDFVLAKPNPNPLLRVTVHLEG